MMEKLTDAFLAKNGSLECRVLKGLDTGEPLKSCDEYIKDAVEILDKYLLDVYKRQHFGRRPGIKTRYRLVKEQQFSRGAQGSCQQHALLLASGKFSVTFAGYAVNSHPAHIFKSEGFFFPVVERSHAAPSLTLSLIHIFAGPIPSAALNKDHILFSK